jgi:putative ABC transport system substrate-binding protein
MKRREFITLVGGTAAAWPLAARAQQPRRMRRIGVLTPFPADDAEGHARLTAFTQALQQLGWTVWQNVRIDYRWGPGNPATMRKHATELVALEPDVILALTTAAVGPLLEASRTVPIVFATVADPVGAGFVETLARPGGNATGFTPYEYSISGKWLELLKEIAPRVTRAAVLRDTSIAMGLAQFGAIQAVAPSLGVELRPVDVSDPGEIERALAAFAQGSNGGMVVIGSPSAAIRRGLISYGPDQIEQFHLAAGYVDRILKGEKPADLPVQSPTKYQTVINLKTAKTLGLEIPSTLLAIADEVIE